MNGQLIKADARSLPMIADESVDCCVTSPPYFGLRDYGVRGQIGLEKTPDEYVRELLAVFREVRRVLKPTGTLWLNLGDSYASAWACARRNVVGNGSLKNGKREARPDRLVDGLKEKDLVGIPWRVAFALQADGWYLRSDIIWAKPNPMPESVTDRPTKAHEYLFLLSKREKYHFDRDAVREPSVGGHASGSKARKLADGTDMRLNTHIGRSIPWPERIDREGRNSRMHQDRDANHSVERKVRASVPRGGFNGKTNALPGREAFRAVRLFRNIRSVWTIASQPYRGSHFATFPERLVEPCIKAGAPVGGVVLDPFGGSGTVALVAERLGRRFVHVDLKYHELAEQRLAASRSKREVVRARA